MKIGKLTTEQLEQSVFSKLKPVRDEVVLRPGVGEDCGALRLGANLCVVSTDPITAAGKEMGRLLVHVCCNDVAACGAEPVGLLISLMAPPETKQEKIDAIMQQISETAEQLQVEILGGHTEITDAVTRMVASGTVIGSCPDGRLVTTGGAKPGDDLVLTKWAGLEGTLIMASDYDTPVIQQVGMDGYQQCLALNQSLSAVTDGVTAAQSGAHAMHDVTEGGVLGAVYELCRASGCGVYLIEKNIPVLPETDRLCHAFTLDPMRLISSGCMLIAAENGKKMVRDLQAKNVPAAIIGQLKWADSGMKIQCADGMTREMAPPGPDELYRFTQRMADSVVSLNQG